MSAKFESEIDVAHMIGSLCQKSNRLTATFLVDCVKQEFVSAINHTRAPILIRNWSRPEHTKYVVTSGSYLRAVLYDFFESGKFLYMYLFTFVFICS